MPDDAQAFVATLAVAKFHGVGPKMAVKMRALGIETGADLRWQTLSFLQDHFGKAGSWYYDIARGRDDRPVQPDRERKSSGSETTFPEDLTDPVQIEAGVIAMADDVWAWCEKANARGRTVTVKIKWADFQLCTRSRSMETREKLHQITLDLIRSVFPPAKRVRLVGVSLSNFRSQSAGEAAELPLHIRPSFQLCRHDLDDRCVQSLGGGEGPIVLKFTGATIDLDRIESRPCCRLLIAKGVEQRLIRIFRSPIVRKRHIVPSTHNGSDAQVCFVVSVSTKQLGE